MRKGFKLFLTFLFFGVMQVQLAQAQNSPWFIIHENPNLKPINAVLGLRTDLKDLFAVANEGWLYESHNYGSYWNEISLNTTANLRSIAYRNGVTGQTTSQEKKIYKEAPNEMVAQPMDVVICGDAGTIIRYNLATAEIMVIDTVTTENLHHVVFDFYRNQYWLAGDNGFLAFSLDDGQHWTTQVLSPPYFNIKKIVVIYDGIILLGDDGQDTYIKKIQIPYGQSPTEAGTDTLRNQKFVSHAYPSGESTTYNYFLTRTSQNSVLLWRFDTYQFPELNYINVSTLPFTNPMSIALWSNYIKNKSQLWITTDSGQIWSSNDGGLSWNVAFEDPQNRALGPMLTVDDMAVNGLALGVSGLTVFNGLVPLEIFPMPGDIIPDGMTEFSVKFSNIPEIASVMGGVSVKSNYSGKLALNVSRDTQEPNLIYFSVQRQGINGGLPGETWEITFSRGIFADVDSINKGELRPFSYQLKFISGRSSNFNFESTPITYSAHQASTNWVAGLFNDDAFLDLITYVNDTLYIFQTQGTPNRVTKKISLTGININVNAEIEKQLKVLDVNNDELPDLLLFDSQKIVLLINDSQGQEITFYRASTYSTNGIIDVIPFNEDLNSETDLLLFTSSISIIKNISEASITSGDEVTIYYDAQNISKVGLGDINGDSRADLVLLSNGTILIQLADFEYGLSYSYVTDTVATGSYLNFTFGDLDHNPPLEIIAQDISQMDVIAYSKLYEDPQNYIQPLFRFNNLGQAQFYLQVDDFGGEFDTDYFNALDIGMLYEDSLWIYRNQTFQPGDFVFNSVPEFRYAFPNSAHQFFLFDYDANALQDMAVVDRINGTLNLLEKKAAWIPEVKVQKFDKNMVELSWSPSPPTMGNLTYYEITRSLSPDFTTDVITYQTTDTMFVDTNIWPFSEYWYTVHAVYDNGERSGLSDPVWVKIYFEISGNLTGVLSDTTLPYLAISDLVVPASDSLHIANHIMIGFFPNTGLDVYGKISVQGINDQNMVNFFGMDSLWRGIVLHQGADTAYFEWFTISDAQNGLWVQERPVKMRLGGVSHCLNGLYFETTDFWLENILIDSCFVGIETGENTKGFIKNIDVLHTRDFSVLSKGRATEVYIKNAIIWNNLGPVAGLDSGRVFINYSTVDRLGPRVWATNISKLPPIFQVIDGKEDFTIDPMSPTIDAGDPADPFNQEPEPNGGRINQGTLGNTYLATSSFQPRVLAKLNKKTLVALPQKIDSTQLFIKNWGYADLHVDSISFKKGFTPPVFFLKENGPMIIPAQDSVAIPFYFNPQARGEFVDTLLVACDDPHLVEGLFPTSVRGFAPNSRPLLTNQPPEIIFVDSLFTYKPQFVDPDGDSVVVEVIAMPDWMDFTTAQEFVGTPSISDTGTQFLHFSFSDQHGGVDSVNFELTVLSSKKQYQMTPIIKAFPVGGAISRQAAIQIMFTVWDSTVNQVKEATHTYHLSGYLYKKDETDPLKVIDTTGVKLFTFYPLSDGDYLFTCVATKLLPTGEQVEVKEEIPFSIRASVKAFDKFRWHMMTLPRNQVLSWEQSGYSDSAAVLYRWDNKERKYQEVNREALLPGQAFWMMPFKRLYFDLNPLPLPESEQSFEIALKKGWNQVGLPWPYYKRWMNMHVLHQATGEVLTLQQAVTDTLIQPAAFWFEQSLEFVGYHVVPFDSTAYTRPWLGYWLYATADVWLIVENTPEFPPLLGNNPEVTPTQLFKKLTQSESGSEKWALNLKLQSGKLIDDFNLIGLSNQPTQPIFEPPAFNEFAVLAVQENEHDYCQLFKPNLQNDNTYEYWDLTVRSAVPDKEHQLQWQPVFGNQKPLYAYLVDLEKEEIINLSEQENYVFTPEKAQYKFRLYVSNDQNFKPVIIPLQFTLAQNFPNPFNPSTTIKVGIPEDGKQAKVALRIFNVLGKEVKTLFKGNLSPGYHQFEWDGTNNVGQAVASGIYFYQLQSSKATLMRKMILLR